MFLVSGLYHQLLDVAVGMAWADSGAVTFFVMMAVGILIEDFTQWVCYDVVMRGGSRGQPWAKAVGFVWVLLFFAYATPFWSYPSLRRNTGGIKDQILPVSILTSFKSEK